MLLRYLMVSVAIVTVVASVARAETRLHESETARGEAHGGPAVETSRPLTVLLDGRPYPLSVRPEGSAYVVERGGETGGETCLAATDWRAGHKLMHLRIEERLLIVQVEMLRGRAFRLVHAGVIRRAQVLSPHAAGLLAAMPEKQPADTSRLVRSPMPGLLAQIVVGEGQEVKAGEPLVVVEAMKMENVLRAERDGRVATLRAKPGDSLAVDQIILELE